MLRELSKSGLFLAAQIDGGYGLASSKRAGRVMKLTARWWRNFAAAIG